MVEQVIPPGAALAVAREIREQREAAVFAALGDETRTAVIVMSCDGIVDEIVEERAVAQLGGVADDGRRGR